MNDVKILGRLVKNPELRKSNDTLRCSFVVACKRDYGQQEADFIPCIAWNAAAKIIYDNFNKGQAILISSGSWNTKRYTRADGSTAYFSCCLVKKFEFVGSKADNYRFIDDDSETDMENIIKKYVSKLPEDDAELDAFFGQL